MLVGEKSAEIILSKTWFTVHPQLTKGGIDKNELKGGTRWNLIEFPGWGTELLTCNYPIVAPQSARLSIRSSQHSSTTGVQNDEI